MIYLDNAASTPMHPHVIAAMQSAMDSLAGNPSSVHQMGRQVKMRLTEARERLADWLHCQSTEIVFTSGGTEANHMALFSAFLAGRKRTDRPHFLTTAIEHHAVLESLELIQDLGADITLLPASLGGRISVDALLDAIRPQTVCVSLMMVNNELGSRLPVEEAVQRIKSIRPDIHLHTDAVQALPNLRLSLSSLGVDSAAFSAHKIHGPKGIGALYIRKGQPFFSSLRGGQQERKRRAGTENILGIIGFAEAVKMLREEWEIRQEKLYRLNRLMRSVFQQIPDCEVLSPDDAVPSILSTAFSGTSSSTMLMQLDLAGFAASAGSACTAGVIAQSHVLSACGYPENIRKSAIRWSLSAMNTESEIEKLKDWLQGHFKSS
ncbi:cysteine desulfurase [Alicyclobacillus sp. TC]|uniref:cysteine desulfurase family protein n=1 Tax=Alicyclobacillus sp. TC TaxID=2606450 RepID=UPI001933B6BE|nr:cysteine desulfurase family protein [Alicyclobacillus sp. TC]QRF23082.1 cysteine desulfurase [Alicyclobacillus sp. TC]